MEKNINEDILNYGEIDINKSKVLIENMDEKEKEKYEFLIQMLPVYQDRVKRDKESYKEEFLKILKKFEEQFTIFLFDPSRKIKGFKELLLFFSHLSHLFKTETDFIPKGLCKILSENYLIIPHEIRLTIVDSLSIMCKSGILSLLEIIPLFFNLMRCQDKILRKRLTDYILSSLTKVNEKHKNVNINKNIQNFCEKLLEDSNKKLARKTLNIIVNLYQKRIWNDSRTINMLANIAVNAKDIKISSAACQFFLSEYNANQEDSSDEEDLEELKNKYKLLGKGYSQKTKKRKTKLKLLMKSIERKEERNKKIKTTSDFLPIDQLNDPLTFAEKLYHLTNSFQSGNFNHKLIILRLLGRVLGRHHLIINNFFNSMIPLIKSEQKDLNIILASIIEATHDQIPPIELEPLIKKLFDFFISDVLPPAQITLGLNTLYGIMDRCPYCINEKYFYICEELKNYKNKSVANAARAVCNLYYDKNIKNNEFGDAYNNDTIEGIELLKKLEKKPKEYKMECEELLTDKQLKQIKALKIKYAAELIQHKKIKDEDVIKNIPKQIKKKFEENENENEEFNDEEELEEIEDEEGEELEDEEGEELEDEEGEEIEDNNSQDKEEKENLNKNENKKDEESENEDELNLGNIELEEIEDDEDEDGVELDDDELEQDEESEESYNKVQGFVNPEELTAYKRTRRERIDEIKNEQKEKFVLNKKRKRENTSKTNNEKLKNKPYQMVAPKKRLEQKKKQDKIESLNKKIRSMKQQVGRFKKGKMVLKKKGGKTTKLKKRK